MEIETYTFDVLPPEVHPGDIVKSISREYAWVLERLGGRKMLTCEKLGIDAKTLSKWLAAEAEEE